MKIYFPQWQGSGKGVTIEPGAKAVLNYLEDDSFVSIKLSQFVLESMVSSYITLIIIKLLMT